MFGDARKAINLEIDTESTNILLSTWISAQCLRQTGMTGSGGQTRWAFRLAQWQPNKEQIRQAFARIQSEEIQRLLKFMFLDDLKASLVGRLLIRNFVARATGQANAGIRIERDERGKPYFAGSENHKLDFNVSHQGGYAVLAGWSRGVARQSKGDDTDDKNIRLGIDVMRMEYAGGKSLQEFFRLMDRNFTAEEWRYIKSGKDRGDLIGRFMRVWCLKESYVKTLGVGITVDLRKIHFHICSPLADTTNELTVSTRVSLNGRTDTEDNWHFEETRLDDEHCVAVAVKGSSVEVRSEGFQFIDIEWLIENIDPLTNEAEIKEELCTQVLQKDKKTG